MLYDGSALASSQNLVVVVIQYRMDHFGWFVHPAGKGGIRSRSGNFGTLDQIYALRWVKENIASFGGDPNRVTTRDRTITDK